MWTPAALVHGHVFPWQVELFTRREWLALAAYITGSEQDEGVE